MVVVFAVVFTVVTVEAVMTDFVAVVVTAVVDLNVVVTVAVDVVSAVVVIAVVFDAVIATVGSAVVTSSPPQAVKNVAKTTSIMGMIFFIALHRII